MPSQQAEKNILRQAENAIRSAEGRARNFYGINLPEASIDFSLRGRCAGQARVDHEDRTSLRINQQLLRENLDDFLNQTIPHEVAHLVVNWQFRKKRKKLRPHGQEWQTVMRNCFDLEPKRCHSYQTTPARVVPRPFLYSCSCREHHLTNIMHNRLSRSYQALCKTCNTKITFIRTQS
jgi:SprT protein